MALAYERAHCEPSAAEIVVGMEMEMVTMALLVMVMVKVMGGTFHNWFHKLSSSFMRELNVPLVYAALGLESSRDEGDDGTQSFGEYHRTKSSSIQPGFAALNASISESAGHGDSDGDG